MIGFARSMRRQDASSEAEARVGTTVAGRYFLQALIGCGAVGEVFKATWLGPDRTVAVKLLRPPAAEQGLFLGFEREADAASRLSHPNCIEVFDHGCTVEGMAYLVMEHVPGPDLARLLAKEGALPVSRAAHIAEQVLSVLVEAHGAGILHLDLKPANVVLDLSREGSDFVKVLDFGIATTGSREPGPQRLQAEGLVRGTPAYMSPEQIRGEPLDARSDLYAVGALLYEMLAGAPPFDGPTTLAVASQVLDGLPPPLTARRRDVPEPLDALVQSALAKSRGARPASAEAMREALAAAAVSAPAAASIPRRVAPTEAFNPAELAPARGRRRRGLFAGAAAGLAALTALFLTLVPDHTHEPLPPKSTSAVVAARLAAIRAHDPESAASARPSVRATPTPAATVGVESPALKPIPPRPAPSPKRPEPHREREAPAPIRLVRGELNAIATPPASSGDGVLVVQASPWAQVSLAGAPLGETPREVRLAAGAYTVVAVHPELGRREDRVVVRPGERTLWTARFESALP